MESIDSYNVGMKFTRLPFRHIVTNAFDQVLEFAVVYPGSQHCFDEVFIFTINLHWWCYGGEGRAGTSITQGLSS
jgi:hypothetical protein